ncbi:metal-dependent transcriptional regulator [Corynebacterium sp. UMB9976]|uniref:Manganese transport regulator n=1 Tax=Corynebacterium urealyticum TaxID=43771 RepID=A0A2W5B655_9CORY|nr:MULTISPECIES: metal-dependent transcriptional regulator [Corynebacterium]MDK6301861.1 metal-dependent transcriptional regulator [Corynebacterium sp. UMB9976]PZP02201.1 MAG: transcriptional regulator [Corynebacterium urealyticum]TYR19794.1 metal-dependent transcriptional regulator [Corynebacterium urealyticum]
MRPENTAGQKAENPLPDQADPFTQNQSLNPEALASIIASLSTSSQDYLKAIWNLREWSANPVTAKALSSQVGVRLSTASDAIKKLREQGFVDHAPYGEVTLTDVGRRVALTMVRRHRLLETFLFNTLGYRWDQVHAEAENLEHAVSDFLVERLADVLGNPATDPHGDPIPSADGQVAMPDATPLTALAPGELGQVVRIADDNSELLRFFESQDLGVGMQVSWDQGAPFSGSVLVQVTGKKSFPLSEDALGAIWVLRPTRN